jgi:hypothetical protein
MVPLSAKRAHSEWRLLGQRPLSGDVVKGFALMIQRSSESKAAQRRP